jgi:hypothetical protein
MSMRREPAQRVSTVPDALLLASSASGPAASAASSVVQPRSLAPVASLEWAVMRMPVHAASVCAM